MGAYMALMKPGDTMLSLDLNSGGHLTHGAAFNFSGKLYKVVHYGLTRDTETLDYAQAAALAKEHKPKVMVVGASAYPRTIDFAKFREIADSVGAAMMVDMAHIAGLVAAGVHPSPVPLADIVTSTTHKTLRGPRGGLVLSKEQYAKTLNSQIFPGIQGGPLMHVIAAKAVAFREALTPEFKAYQRQIVANAQALAEALKRGGPAAVLGRHRQPPDAGGPAPQEAHRQGGRGGAGQGRHHGEQEHDSLRPGEAHGDVGRAHRHAGRHHARDEGGGDGHHWRLVVEALDHASDETAADAASASAGQGVHPELPALRLAAEVTSSLLGEGEAPTMRCPFCQDAENKVIDSRESHEGAVIRRRRECLQCKRRFTTYERVEELYPLIVKKDGRREAFDRDKLLAGLKKACEKRPVSADQLEETVVAIERLLQGMGEKEVPSSVIGEEVMRRLHGAGRGGLCPLRVGVPELP